ncbi:hypothetical protein [Suttonella indologenes]|uniref:Integrating conjugative element protein, PFL_4701 family n=1 Tax=Suttonella indologenes TaxID=13276 RepID=A0A380MHT1_9GAMM|nr:hypothetical protein [Suttonella indologenes]SUO90281.1 Uncharacterised protein [Suttonella indologenes]
MAEKTIAEVRASFDAAGTGGNSDAKAGAYSVLFIAVLIGVFLIFLIFASLSSLRMGERDEERGINFMRVAGIGLMTLFILLLFIGVVTVTT